MRCPLCGYRFDPTKLACPAACQLAALQGCHLVCCPNCGYQTVDERKSGLARLLRRVLRTTEGEEPTAEADVGLVIELHRLKPGQVAEIVELRSRDPARLDRLGALGLVPGSRIVLQQVEPALVFRVGETEVSIDLAVADEILVRTR